MQCLITLSINTSLPAPGRWGSSRNSRCLLLLLTSASTAVKLDHYDANLRRCCNPGEEPGSVRLIEREEEEEGGSKSDARMRKGENDECMRIAGRETDRDPCLGVIVSTVMMKQSPPCHDDKNSAPYSQKPIPWYLFLLVKGGYETINTSVSFPLWPQSKWQSDSYSVVHLEILLLLKQNGIRSYHICFTSSSSGWVLFDTVQNLHNIMTHRHVGVYDKSHLLYV